jgi:hypothetical protein
MRFSGLACEETHFREDGRVAAVKLFQVDICVCLLCLFGAFWAPAVYGAVSARPQTPTWWRGAQADYDAEPRLPDGRVDVDALVARLKELGVTTYYWLVYHAPSDWDDLELFLPKAAEAGLDVWVYLVPPSEGPPPHPFGLDYKRWAEEIAHRSRQHPNLTAWVIDDFYENRSLFTPAYVREMRARARRISPHLGFYPLMYYDEIRPAFVSDYREVVDGVVVAYPQGRDEIEEAWGVLNDAPVASAAEMSYPPETSSHAGDFVMASGSVHVTSSGRCEIRFRERDTYTGPTAGYHVKQLLVDGVVAWEADVAGGTGAWREVTVDVTPLTRGKTNVTLAFRLLDQRGVSNFGVRWRLRDLLAEGLQLVTDLAAPQRWRVTRRGAFETSFGRAVAAPRRRFHVPFIVMTAGDAEEFRMRHGDPASPERMAEWLRMSLRAWREGKCDGVVTYCLDKRPGSRIFDLARELFHAPAYGGG